MVQDHLNAQADILRQARPEEDKAADTLKGLKSAAGFLRHELGARLNLRHTPQLQFVPDDSIAYGAHIFDLLSKLDIPEDKHDDNAE